MRSENIKNIFDNIKPDMSSKERMLENILDSSTKRRNFTVLPFNFRKAILALTLMAIFTVGMFIYHSKHAFLDSGLNGSDSPKIEQDNLTGTDSFSGSEDMAAPILNQFQLGNRHYIHISNYAEEFGFPATIDSRDIGPKLAVIEKSPDKNLVGCEVFSYLPAGCEAVVALKRDNGYELYKFYAFESYIDNQDEDAIEYLKLYGINSPDDIAKILFIAYTEKSKLEGTTDIIGEITERNEIATFYSYYSVLKNSSDKYFEKLFGSSSDTGDVEDNHVYPNMQNDDDVHNASNIDPIAPDYIPEPDYNGEAGTGSIYPGIANDMPLTADGSSDNVAYFISPTDISQPTDMPVTGGDTPASMINDRGESSDSKEDSQYGMIDIGGNEPVIINPSQGSAGYALDGSVAIRIYNKNGVYFEAIYFKNIGFISRYEIAKDFATFIEYYIN